MPNLPRVSRRSTLRPVVSIDSFKRSAGVGADPVFGDPGTFVPFPIDTTGGDTLPPVDTPPSGTNPINWTSVLNNADNGLMSILRLTLTPRTTLVQTPQGTFYSTPAGLAPATTGLFGGAGVFGSTSSSILPWVLLGGGVLLVAAMVAKR